MVSKYLKRITLIALAVVIAFAFSAPVVNAAKPIKMRIIYAYPDTTQHGKNMIKWKELAEKYTDGRLSVSLFPNASICPTNREMATVLSRGAEASYLMCGSAQCVDKAEAIWSVPFLFKTKPGDCRHTRAAYTDKRIMGPLEARLEKKGYKLLGIAQTVDGFFICANNVRPINKYEDFKGLKMRSQGGMFNEFYFSMFGAHCAVIPGTEVPVALSTGVADGVTTCALHWHDARWHTKYLTLPFWCALPMLFVVNLDWWNSLPADIQDTLENKVMPEVREWSLDEVDRKTIALLKEVVDPPYNVTINTLPASEMKRMEEICQAPAIEKFRKEVGKELADQLIEAARDLTPADLK